MGGEWGGWGERWGGWGWNGNWGGGFGGPGGVPRGALVAQSRERDALEAVLKEWEGGQRDPPRDPLRDWDQRLRRLHGVRYDARAALADWDLRMELHQRGVRGGRGDQGGMGVMGRRRGMG